MHVGGHGDPTCASFLIEIPFSRSNASHHVNSEAESLEARANRHFHRAVKGCGPKTLVRVINPDVRGWLGSTTGQPARRAADDVSGVGTSEGMPVSKST